VYEIQDIYMFAGCLSATHTTTNYSSSPQIM